jgi:small-conductance mechanosensitive channel
MTYTNLLLFALGLLGIIIHNLKNMNTINKASKGNINIWQYFKIEVYAILLSVCLVVVSIIVKSEIKQLEFAGQWLGIGYVAIGFMAQSIVISFAGKSQKIIDATFGNDTTPTQDDKDGSGDQKL